MASLANALRLVVGGATGALEGYGAKQERLRRDEEEKRQQSRQVMIDALALIDRGALPTAQREAVGRQATGEIGKSVLSAMNMAGGGPSIAFDSGAIAAGAGRMGPPAAEFEVGGVKYTLPDPEQRRLAKEAQDAAAALTQRRGVLALDREEKTAEYRRIQELGVAAQRGGARSPSAIQLAIESPAAYRAIFPEPTRVDPMDTLRREEAMRERDLQEAQGMAFLDANRRNPAVTNAYASVFAKNPKMSMGMVGYSIMQQQMAGALTEQREASAGASTARATAIGKKSGGRAPSAPPPGAAGASAVPPAVSVKDELDTAYDRYTQPKR